MSNPSVGNLGGSVGMGSDELRRSSVKVIGRVADNPDKLSSSSMLVAPLDPADPTLDDLGLPMISSRLDRLLSLLARLFRSFPLLTLDELLPLASLPLKGVSRSNPYCSKDRLKDVPLSD